MTLRAQDIIAKKRDGETLSTEEITAFIAGYVSGEIADYQASAWLMAVYLRGMTTEETAALTRAMAESGRMLRLTDAGLPPDAPTIDKHSTGGVGDKTSLIVVPLLAAAGAFVCKMSGRGLGHTGGTLDKLESIPGFRVGLTPEEMVAQVARIGACLAGQTGDLAPADKQLYALRDATATVGSLPLIVSSILSKKLAGGAQSLLFDVKVGDGAILETEDEARELAGALVDGAVANGREAVAVLSNMDAPLGRAIGNALEIAEAITILSPEVPDEAKDARLQEVCLTLTAEGLLLCGISSSPEVARARAVELLQSGAGRAKLREIIVAQGGEGRVVEEPARVLPQAPVQIPVLATVGGTITGIGARAVGETVVALGGGRARKEDRIDTAVGVVLAQTVGATVAAGDTLAVVHAREEESAHQAAERVLLAFTIAPTDASPTPLMHDIIRSAGS